MSWLRIDDEGPVRVVTLDRPERKNAIPVTGWAELEDVFRDFEGSDARVLIVTGSGGDFCAGADLDESRLGETPPVPERYTRMKTVGAAATALNRLTKPTIAAVDGVAVGPV